MKRNDIITTLVFYKRFFPGVKGDPGKRQELAEKLADELLGYPAHDLWEAVEYLYKNLPRNKKR